MWLAGRGVARQRLDKRYCALKHTFARCCYSRSNRVGQAQWQAMQRSQPATRLRRMREVNDDERFVRLGSIPVAQLHNSATTPLP